MNVAADQTAKQKADDIRKRALAGESFDQLASRVSDSPSKANGGLIGPLNTNELTPAFKQLVDPMKVGEVSEVLRGQGGYQIIKIENRTADEVMTPRPRTTRFPTRSTKRSAQVHIRRYLNKLRSQATIEWRNEEIRKAFETGLPRSRAAARSECGARRRRRPPTSSRARARARKSRSRRTTEHASARGAHRAARSASASRRWYAVWTRSRHEQAVRAQLDEKALPAFLPTMSRWSRWKDRKKHIEVPLFPGYVFARFDPAARLAVLKCSGVVSIVSFNGEPAPVPDHEIEGIRTLVESTLPFDPCPTIKTGTLVEVSHGPLKGVVGRLTRKGSQARLVLSVDLIGQGVSVEVDAADVKVR